MSTESPSSTDPVARPYSRRETAGWMLLTGGSQAVKLIVTLLSAAILARLLKPEDFGLIATATPVFAFATMLQNLGLAEALYQRPSIERGHINALFVVTIGVSVSFGLVLLLLAPAIASVFHEPRLVHIIWAMAGVAIIIAGATIPFGMLSRKLRFKQFAAVEIASSVGGIVAGVVFAMLTHNYWALVIMQAATALTMMIGAFACAGWAPGKPVFDRDLRTMIGLGAGFSAFNVLNFLSRNADLLLISFAHGPGPLGLYERAYKLTMFPLWQAVAPINRVLSPVLSRLQGDHATYRERYFETTSLMMAAVQPGLLAAIVFSGAAVGVILGPGWGGSAPIFFWLGLTGLVQIYAYPVSWLLISQGRAKECAAMGAVTAGIAIASFVIGLPFGPLGVAMAYAIGDITLRTPIAWWFAGRRGPVSFASLVSNFIPHAAAMAASAAVLILLSKVWTFENFFELSVGALISYAVYMPVLCAFADKRRLVRLALAAIERRWKGPRFSLPRRSNMRICAIGLRGIPDVMGGIETHCEHLYPHLAKLDENLEIVVIGRSGYAKPGQFGKVRVVSLWAPRRKGLETLIHTPLAILWARLFLHPDVIHLHAIGPGFFAPLARALGFRVIATHHAADYDRPKWGRLGKWFLKAGERMIALFANDVICVSSTIEEDLSRRYPAAKSRTVTIRNGAPKSEIHAAAAVDPLAQFQLTRGGYILGVGRLDPTKGFHDLVHAFQSARPRGMKLVIAGGAPEGDAYASQLRGQAAHDIIFTGPLPAESVRALYRNAALFVHPSYLEGFAMVVLEAVEADAPMLVTDIPAHREVGLDASAFYMPGDVTVLANRLASGVYDKLRCSRREAILSENDWEKIAERHREIIIRNAPMRQRIKRPPAHDAHASGA